MRQDHSPFAHYLSFPYTDLPSPSTSTRPFYFTNAYSTSTPSPSEHPSKHQRQQYFDFTHSIGGGESYDTSALGAYSSMPTPPYQLQNPPIRVQQSTPTPTPHLSREPSHSQNSMLLENPLSRSEWQSYEGTVDQLSPAALQHLQSPQRRGRGHQRASSGSSIGSAGPPSPYDHSTSNPYIAHSEASSLSPSGYDSSYDDISSADAEGSAAFSKPSSQPPHTSFLAPAFQNYNPSTHDSETTFAAQMAMKQALMEQHGSVEEDVPGFSYSGRHSVSSIGHPSPATPSTSYGDHVPKLDRTMSDIYQDELYNPAPPTSAHIPHGLPHSNNNSLLSPYRNIITERLQTANNNHLTDRSQSPSESGNRERSPFREGSRLAPVESNYAARAPSPSRLGTAAQMREQQKAEADALALRQHQPSPVEVATPNTISPRDAMLDYHESEEDTPLFPQSASSGQFNTSNYNTHNRRTQNDSQDFASDNSDNSSFENITSTREQSSSGYSSTPAPFNTGSSFTFVPPSVPGSIQVPSRYPFGSHQHQQSGATGSPSNEVEQTPEFPAHLTSMESSASDAGPETFGDVNKPTSTMADSGTYTCTYHGCALRFETPAKLQKHKREGHRQTTPSVGGSSGMTSAALMRNSQAGPHRCERINPSTGKPCNTVFSRPYDLTRHEDTIHNARKQKVRCHLCTEEKTFSRNDALTRHMRVVHPEVDFPGKTRRKNQD